MLLSVLLYLRYFIQLASCNSCVFLVSLHLKSHLSEIFRRSGSEVSKDVRGDGTVVCSYIVSNTNLSRVLSLSNRGSEDKDSTHKKRIVDYVHSRVQINDPVR